MTEDARLPTRRWTPISMRRYGFHYLERLLWVAGMLLLSVCICAVSEILLARRSAALVLPLSQKIDLAEPFVEPASGDIDQKTLTAIVGRVEIPAIGLSTPLLAGDDSMSLTQGAGHIPGTAYPGGLGTVGIAGHRDTHFRLLNHVVRGMDIRLIDRTGTWHYRVTSTEIVTPEQVSVLDILSQPGLALITCYPFSYLGHAPKRYVVHAALLSAAPDEMR